MRGKVKLVYTSSSPYARKVRACIRHFQWLEIEEVMLHPFENESIVRKLNPLGKIPILEFKGQQLMDSEVIIRFLKRFFGHKHEPCFSELKCLTLCQGLMDVAVNLRVDFVRKTPPDWWTQRLKSSIVETLDELQKQCGQNLLTKSDGHLAISLVCAAEYLEFRHSEWLRLSNWHSLNQVIKKYSQLNCLNETPFG
tara:strand:- start:303 stop:890 length:588 start_codon:yes stop_codon:yes gene_type:complete